MKKTLIPLLAAVLLALSTCNSSSPPASDSPASAAPSSTTLTPEPAPEPDPDPLEVFLDIDTAGEDGKPQFTITTNLPDETVLSLEVSLEEPLDGQSDYVEQQELVVNDGVVTTEVFTNGADPLIGNYCVSVVMLPSEQPEQVKAIIGEEGENLAGQLVTAFGDGSYQYISASTEYCSPYQPEEESLSLGDVYMAVGTILSYGFGENYSLSLDGNTFIANVWGDGVAMNATLAYNGDCASLETWNSLVDSTLSAAESIQSLLTDNGYDDVIFIMQVVNDLDESHDRVLLSVSLGVVFYDYVNGIDLT